MLFQKEEKHFFHVETEDHSIFTTSTLPHVIPDNFYSQNSVEISSLSLNFYHFQGINFHMKFNQNLFSNCFLK